MNDYSPPFIKEFNSVIEEAELFLSITRDSELQQGAVDSLKGLQSKVFALKNRAIDKKDENLANMLLGYECVIEVLIAELEMWILLKKEDPDVAWDKLVKAQMLSAAAIRAHPGFGHVIQHYERLEKIEQLIFPPQVFMSSGLIIKNFKCSICSGEYEDCEHLVGKPYMGKFCYVIAQDTEVDHVAMVDHPADKRCRITEFDVEGGVRNRMSWRVEKKESAQRGRASARLL